MNLSGKDDERARLPQKWPRFESQRRRLNMISGSLVPRHLIFPCCPREVWERVGKSSHSRSGHGCSKRG